MDKLQPCGFLGSGPNNIANPNLPFTHVNPSVYFDTNQYNILWVQLDFVLGYFSLSCRDHTWVKYIWRTSFHAIHFLPFWVLTYFDIFLVWYSISSEVFGTDILGFEWICDQGASRTNPWDSIDAQIISLTSRNPLWFTTITHRARPWFYLWQYLGFLSLPIETPVF